MVALGLVAYEIYETQGDGRRQLEQRFAIRADLASRFVETYAAEVLTRERAQATTQLAKPRVAESDFKAVVVGGGYQAAVLLDAQGRLLQIAPAKPALLGTQVGSKYPHLRSALKGKAAVSPVVPAAAGGAPSSGSPRRSTPRRGGASSAARSTSGRARSPPTCRASRRSSRARSTSSTPTGRSSPRAGARRARASRRSSWWPVRRWIATRPIAARRSASPSGPSRARRGGWSSRCPSAQLYAPLSTTGRWFAWAGLVIAALASLLVALLVGRLLKTRTELVADIAQRRVVERQLSDAQTRFHRAFAEAPIGMALVDLDGGWRQVNQALCTMLRYSEAELLTATRDQLTHADDLGDDMEQVDCPDRRRDRPLRDGEALPRRPRRGRVDLGLALARPRRRQRRAAVLHRPGPGHHRAPPVRGQALPPGRPRRADRALQPPPPRARARPPGGLHRALPGRRGAADARPRQLQVRQRHARPRDGRRADRPRRERPAASACATPT